MSCYRKRCKADAPFAVDQMSWRDHSCAKHLGDLIMNRTAHETLTVTVTRIAVAATPAGAQS